MADSRVLSYFCRVEGEELVCVAFLRVGDRYLRKEFREKLEGIPAGLEEGALGC